MMPRNIGIDGVRTALAAVALAMAAQGVAAQAQAANGVGTPFELAFWQSVGTSDDPALYEAYLQQYPQGTFAALARAKAAALRHGATTTTPAPPAPAPAAPVPAAAPAPVAAPAATLPAPAVGPALAMAAPLAVPGTVAAAAPVANIALGQLLADLARSQQTPAPGAASPSAVALPAAPVPAAVAAVSPVSPRYVVPQRPQMVAVPDLVLPPGFCSAEDRNRFHDTVYRPAVDAAKRNNDAAVAYLKQLQGIYDGYDLGKDTAAMNALAAEARAYQADAAATFSQQAALVRAFDALMAVPLQPCGTAK